MAIADRHIHIAATLIAEYDYETPFHHFLSSFFSRNRQMGNRDRKTVREACYAFFRFGKLLPEWSAEEKIRLVFWSKGLIEQPPLSMGEGAGERSLVSFLEKNKISLENLFPCVEQISSRMPKEDFAKQHLFAGKVFFRKTRKGTTEPFDFVQGTNVEQLAENIYSVETATSLNALTDKGFVQVQDLASQEICRKMEVETTCWDICAGAGGKALHLQELHPETRFFVSDIRPAVLENLKQRAAISGHKPFASCVADLTEPHSELVFSDKEGKVKVGKGYFDTLVADVPCSGSGVWRRTPENLLAFSCSDIERYAELQKKIIQNALPFLKAGGLLHYITCSVFEAENEGHFSFFEKCGLSLVQSGYHNYQTQGGDVLFHAVLRKTNQNLPLQI